MSRTRIVIIVIASFALVVSGFMFAVSLIEYKQAEAEYEGLESYAKVGEGIVSEEEAPEDGGEEEITLIDSEEKERIIPRNYNRGDFPDMSVDFDGLKKINQSCVCWVYASGAQINHPVVQADDNEFYLHHTFERKKNSAGCIFMDHEVDPNLSSWNTFIYGHNMKNGTMFGHLKNYINNPSVYEKDPYIYIFRPEGIYRYEIFAFYLDPTDSKMYYTCSTFREFRAYLREAAKKSVYECKAKSDPDKNIVTLVTCSGSGSNKQRFFVHGVIKDCYLY